MHEVTTPDAPAPIGPYSQGIVDGDRVYVSGQGPADPETGRVEVEAVADQTARTIRNVEAVLRAAGTGLDGLVRATVYLTDMADYDEMNGVYADLLDEPYPARAVVEVSRLPMDIDVEVEAAATLRGA